MKKRSNNPRNQHIIKKRKFSKERRIVELKNTSLFVAGLLTVIVFLIYQLIDLKQQIRNANNNQMISMNGNLSLYNQNPNSLSGGSSSVGFWLYIEAEKQVYFFRYDQETNQIIQMKKNILEQ